VTRISPATCSTQCLNRHITPALCSAAFPLGIHKDCISESKAIRYITSCYYPQSIGVAPVVVAIVVPEDCMLLEIMTKPNSVMPWLSTSQDNLFSESQECFLDAIKLWLDSGKAKATMATTCAVGKITVNDVLLFRE